ncbi:hypothetical protein K443DRAFT_366401 [Laccaria amethystina LaAM-08-1]|uniref:Uncharacterized protein n=1 Tax=Laccaria amethystina LaAM-08-1 TaxID=1095629 RepID=A0A0C9WJ81_9AGAR|nr:hypothetical protein K443DRAFT_366401 [Laccaria amethystina LaAM-08-1]
MLRRAIYVYGLNVLMGTRFQRLYTPEYPNQPLNLSNDPTYNRPLTLHRLTPSGIARCAQYKICATLPK